MTHSGLDEAHQYQGEILPLLVRLVGEVAGVKASQEAGFAAHSSAIDRIATETTAQLDRMEEKIDYTNGNVRRHQTWIDDHNKDALVRKTRREQRSEDRAKLGALWDILTNDVIKLGGALVFGGAIVWGWFQW